METLVYTCRCTIADQEYEVLVFSRPDGSHTAKTFFTPSDVIINDGSSLEEVLNRHQRLLPLAITSRELLRSARHPN
jgi:hypothetical protein